MLLCSGDLSLDLRNRMIKYFVFPVKIGSLRDVDIPYDVENK